MPTKGVITTKKFNGTFDYSHIQNVPKFADEVQTSTNIINEVNRAKFAESSLDSKILALRAEVQDAFGGTFSEIKAVYGNLSTIQSSFVSIDEIINNMSPQTIIGGGSRVLTSRLNNLEQIIFNMKR